MIIHYYHYSVMTSSQPSLSWVLWRTLVRPLCSRILTKATPSAPPVPARSSIPMGRKSGQLKYCTHGRRRNTCVDCGGRSVCVHGRLKAQCRECGGSAFCVHGWRSSTCRLGCGRSTQICPHNRFISHCKECGGSQICSHDSFAVWSRFFFLVSVFTCVLIALKHSESHV